MTTDPLDRLRSSNPVPHGSSAPPLESVLSRIRAAGPARHRWVSALVPVLAAVVAIAVAVVALVALHHRARATVPATPTTSTSITTPTSMPTTTPTTPSLSLPGVPARGMPGNVIVLGAAFASPDQGMISLQQCQPCRAGAAAPTFNWVAMTTDGGATWRVTRRSWYPSALSFSGSDAWAEGVQVVKGAGVARFYVSHDGGRGWSVPASPAPAPGEGGVSIAGGEVWSLGSSCGAERCPDTILHGRASGSQLEPTARQPTIDASVNVIAVARGVAYVFDSEARRLFATHDDGASWQRLTPPCPPHSDAVMNGAGSSWLWATCQPQQGAISLRRSTDGAHHWQTLPIPYRQAGEVLPVSSQVAWALTASGQVVRSSDGGASWSTVWSQESKQAAALIAAGLAPTLTAQSPSSATLVLTVPRGHVGNHARFTNLLVYRTSNSGATWQTSLVRLTDR